jgi:hypothetical protein
MSYRVITRGVPRPIVAEFLCPHHGRFEAAVDSGAESASCPSTVGTFLEACGAVSPWSPSKAPPMRMRRVEATRGKSERAEHKGWCDTTNLEEGQSFDDWQADRERVHEELRQELVMDLVRSDR